MKGKFVSTPVDIASSSLDTFWSHQVVAFSRGPQCELLCFQQFRFDDVVWSM